MHAAVSPPRSLSRSLPDVQARLETDLPSTEASALLTWLSAQSVDPQVLATTKIGITVNKMRRRYLNDRVIVALATSLIDKWKKMWNEKSK